MRAPNFRVALPIVGLLAASALTGCSSVSDVTKERVARSEQSYQQAQQAVGNSEAGAIELQRSKDNLAQAKAALDKKKQEPAERYAQLAQLDAELALSKAQSAQARKAADELLASIQQLRQEVSRGAVASDQ
jgi:chromosome segregation ATPase